MCCCFLTLHQASRRPQLSALDFLADSARCLTAAHHSVLHQKPHSLCFMALHSVTRVAVLQEWKDTGMNGTDFAAKELKAALEGCAK